MAFLRGKLKPPPWIAKFFLMLLVVGFLLLSHNGYLDEFRALLDSELLSFHLGKANFSVYQVIRVILVTVFLLWFARVFSKFMEENLGLIPGIEATDHALAAKTLQVIIYFACFVLGLNILGLNFKSLALFGGALGIGIGFGLQKITANFISGLILLFERSVRVDDLVEFTGGVYGKIKRAGARCAMIETFDGREVMVPNEDFIASRVTNWTYTNTKARIDIRLGVAYDSDLEQVMAIMLEAARSNLRCLGEPEPACHLSEFGEDSVNFLLSFWVDDISEDIFDKAKSDIMLLIWHQFKTNDIAMHSPKDDKHIKSPKDLT